jgi:hypothetical protein
MEGSGVQEEGREQRKGLQPRLEEGFELAFQQGDPAQPEKKQELQPGYYPLE